MKCFFLDIPKYGYRIVLMLLGASQVERCVRKLGICSVYMPHRMGKEVIVKTLITLNDSSNKMHQ